MERNEKIEQAFREYQEKKQTIIDSDAKIKYINLKKFIRPLLRKVLFAQRKINGQTIEFINSEIEETEQNIIFAVTHIGKWDFEMVNESIKPHFHIVASDFRNMYGNISGLFMNANGVIFINEEDKKDRSNSKKMIKKVLSQDDNIMIFPEGTWNLSENEIVRDIHFGTVDCGLETNSVIIPIAIEQYDKRFVINIGKIFDPSKITEKYGVEYKKLDSQSEKDQLLKFKIKLEANQILRDQMATLKWEIWEREGVSSRNEIPADYWNQFIEDRKKEWPGYSMEEQQINGFFPKEKVEYDQVQEDMKNIMPNCNNMFLFMNEQAFVKQYGKNRGN